MLIQVPVEKLEIGMVAQQDIISTEKGALIVKKGTKLSESIIGRLLGCGAEHVLVEVPAEYLKKHPHAEHLKEHPLAENLPPAGSKPAADIPPAPCQAPCAGSETRWPSPSMTTTCW